MNKHNEAGRGKKAVIRIVAVAAVIVLISPLQACLNDSNSRPSRIPEVADNPAPPEPEAISVVWLPLPPAAPTDADGAVIDGGCANPTGCMDPGYHGIAEGPSYMWDNEHVLLPVLFSGAPAGSVYVGQQVIAVKTTEGAVFPNGDPWKCISCGVPEANQVGRNQALDHPQAFIDGTRVLAGNNVISCGERRVTDSDCTPEQTRIYPLDSPTRESSFLSPRELRLNSDDVTIGYSQFAFSASGITQYCYLGRLNFVESPTPRYELVDVHRLLTLEPSEQAWQVDPENSSRLLFSPATKTCGELRGFTSDGKKVVSLNSPAESNHVDLFTTDIETGSAERLTRTEYVDPIKVSPDDGWFISLDVNVARRSHFIAGLDGLLPVNDMHTVAFISAVRNNRQRRFFQPMLVDRWGQRGSYQGQQINGGFDASPGGISDPNWNARADPAWSPDGTKVVYWQSLVTSPACGDTNPLPCPESTEPGGRRSRLMMAQLTDRQPLPLRTAPVEPPEIGDWAMPFVAGERPEVPVLPAGDYTVFGTESGSAEISIVLDDDQRSVRSTTVIYTDYANDCRVFNGEEFVESLGGTVFGGDSVWDVDISMSGCEEGSKRTFDESGAPGAMTMSSAGSVFKSQGSMKTVVDDVEYIEPEDGT